MPDSPSSLESVNRAAMLDHISRLETYFQAALDGGGARAIQRHRDRGGLLPRERIALLVDPASPFLELSATAAAGTEFPTGASVVTGIGLVQGLPVAILANDPTVRGGATNPYTTTKLLRLFDIAEQNRLPFISLVESGGADLPTQANFFLRGGGQFRSLAMLSAAGIPTASVVFGNATAGGAYLPGMSDYVILVRERSKMFLGGPPLVKMATGEESDAESLGGAAMHTRESGVGDYLAESEVDAIRIAREVVSTWPAAVERTWSTGPHDPPLHPAETLLDVFPADLRQPFEPSLLLERVLDGGRFSEFKPLYGRSLTTGWGTLCGFRVGIVANRAGVIFSEEANKASQFIQLCNKLRTPIVFVQNTTGFMVGEQYERRGIIKDGAKLINIVSNSRVPHITLVMGSSYGAGNYGMSGRAFRPRFVFAWPNSKTAVMGAQQLAGVMSIVRQQAAASRGEPWDAEEDAELRRGIEEQIEAEADAFYNSARLHDDGVIDPRDTRWVLALALMASADQDHEPTPTNYGTFRM